MSDVVVWLYTVRGGVFALRLADSLDVSRISHNFSTPLTPKLSAPEYFPSPSDLGSSFHKFFQTSEALILVFKLFSRL
jgi:hypothetical protein